jgi:hypothetical protein
MMLHQVVGAVIACLFGPLRTGNIVFQQPALGQGYGNTLPWDHQGLFDFEKVLTPMRQISAVASAPDVEAADKHRELREQLYLHRADTNLSKLWGPKALEQIRPLRNRAEL